MTHGGGARKTGLVSTGIPKIKKDSNMHIQQENEFVHTPILENRVFFLTSQCGYCGYLVLASSALELLDEEEQHALECKAKHGLRPGRHSEAQQH